MDKSITPQTLQRLPMYFSYLTSLPESRRSGYISATAIAGALGLNDVQVRKDLASVSSAGKPRVGYPAAELIRDIGRTLGFENHDCVAVVGMGNFGRAMMNHTCFAEYGFTIAAGFDIAPDIIGTEIGGKPVYHISELSSVCSAEDIHIGIITVPENAAQEVCSLMADAGIRYILNFAPVHLNVPSGVTVQNFNISLTLAMLTRGGN
ncbi:MAG: redox-sensing transcriptional repressor Rex [Ruminococcus sp.]|nr:redox-sensing transcriptional repressor Rex [Ruminococcus sp.]